MWEEDGSACLGGLLAGLMNYCMKNTRNRTSPIGSAQCELPFLPLAVLHIVLTWPSTVGAECPINVWMSIMGGRKGDIPDICEDIQGQRLRVPSGSWDEVGELGCDVACSGSSQLLGT